MNSLPGISIPLPCHEDWTKMTVAHDGRFCASCAKNVIDFSTKSNVEIHRILAENKGQSVCGRFRKDQLDSVKIEIPKSVFFTKMPFRRAFLLALFTTMGSVLFSCSTDDGQKQSIETQIVDSPDEMRFVAGAVSYIDPSDVKYYNLQVFDEAFAENPGNWNEIDTAAAVIPDEDFPDLTLPDSLAATNEFDIR